MEINTYQNQKAVNPYLEKGTCISIIPQRLLTPITINILSTIHKVDTALFKNLVDKKICLLYAGVHLIKGSSESKVLINEGKQGCPSI